MLNRRQFIQTTSLAGISPFLMNTVPVVDSLKSFRASLNPGAIGLQCNAQELLDYAIMFNFSSISPLLNDLVTFSSNEKKAYLEKMINHGIKFDGGGLPIEFRSSEKIFQQGLRFLQKNIKIIASFNIPSFVTWIMPTNKSLTYLQNFNQHQKRLKQVAAVLEEEGLKLGLEFVGPKTLMSRDKYSFLHSINELRELIDAIAKKNVGYLLDSFHTYCAGDQIENMDFLEAKDIVSVQINESYRVILE
jgi:sugar phosphate isomerase/epimerase